MKNIYIVGLLSLTLLITSIYQKEEQVDEYDQWKQKYHKLYLGAEDTYRKQIFHQNLQLVKEHNLKYEQGLESFSIDTNRFADLTFEEFSSLYLYAKHPDQESLNKKQSVKRNTHKTRGATADHHDWTEKIPAPYPVYDQGRCLGSWAFAVAGSVEIAFFDGGYVQKSPQHLINCVAQANPCLEGIVANTWTWVGSHIVDSETNVPYTGQKAACVQATDGSIIKESKKFGPTDFQTDEDYYKALVQQAVVSPLSVSNILFQLYKQGVYDKGCGKDYNYDALVIGYDAREDLGYKPFYKLKMSWSDQYGETGFVRIAMDNECLYSGQSYAVNENV